MGTTPLEGTHVFLAVHPGLPQHLEYDSRKTGKAGECEQISGEMAHCPELGVTAASLCSFAGEALRFPSDPTVLLIHYLRTGKA